MTARAAATALLLMLLTCAPALAADRDRDRMPDRWERKHRLKKPGRDADRDGLTNLREYRARTNPRRRDSDRDGLRDGDEIRFGWHPRRRDSDRDGIRDGKENAGVVSAVAGRRVTIRLAAGGRLRGRLEDPAALACVPAAGTQPGDADLTVEPEDGEPAPLPDDFDWDEEAWGEMPADLDGDAADDGDGPLARVAQAQEEPLDEEEEEAEAEEDAGAAIGDEDCRAALRAGARVHEATSELGASGRRLTRLRLVT